MTRITHVSSAVSGAMPAFLFAATIFGAVICDVSDIRAAETVRDFRMAQESLREPTRFRATHLTTSQDKPRGQIRSQMMFSVGHLN